jgi:hypothetical protein
MAEVIDLGWANSWGEQTPPIVLACIKQGHRPRETNMDPTWRGLNTEVRCDACGYKYNYDSSG